MRWYLRLFIRFRFLWRICRLNLHLVPTHPDRAAGLAFLGKSAYAFGPILFAQGAMLAGLIASRVLYRGEHLISFKLQIAGFIAFFVLVILGPLLMFTPGLAQAKRKGLATMDCSLSATSMASNGSRFLSTALLLRTSSELVTSSRLPISAIAMPSCAICALCRLDWRTSLDWRWQRRLCSCLSYSPFSRPKSSSRVSSKRCFEVQEG